MGHGKETPRQKMIGLMYLFLTCLMCLNVSKDILDAFININQSLGQTNTNFISKNKIAYDAIDKAYASNPAKLKETYDYAQLLKQKADSLVLLMQDCKEDIIITADGVDTSLLFLNPLNSGDIRKWIYDEGNEDTVLLENFISSKDNLDYPAQIMIGQEGNPGRAVTELKPAINTFKEWCINAALDPKYRLDTNATIIKQIKLRFDTEDKRGQGHEGGMLTWEYTNFSHLPLIAVVAILTEMQTGVRNVEGDLLNLMYGSLDAESFKFNKLEPIVLAPSTYIMQGNEYNAKIFLAAFDTTQNPVVEIGRIVEDPKGQYITNMNDGKKYKINNPQIVSVDSLTNMATYKVRGSGIGDQKYTGLIKFPKPNSSDSVVYKFEGEYQVAKPSLVVSPTKMNVFYIGPENPVEISVPGVPGDKITASLSPSNYGSIRKSGSGYIVKVTRAGKCKINVTAELNGKKQNMGSVEFRIKKVPDPVASVLGMEGGDITKARLSAARTVEAKMKDFDFDLKFNVTGFTVSAKIGAYFVEERSTSARITQQMKQSIFSKVTKNTKVYFEDVKARGPDGRTRALGVLLFKIK